MYINVINMIYDSATAINTDNVREFYKREFDNKYSIEMSYSDNDANVMSLCFTDEVDRDAAYDDIIAGLLASTIVLNITAS